MRKGLQLMKAQTMVYLSKQTTISANWHAPLPPGWTEEGGWLGLSDGEIDGTQFTIYLDRANALRLQQVINDLVAGMDSAGPVFDGLTVVSAGG